MRGKLIWRGHPAQALNQSTYLICALTFWLVLPLVYAWLKYRRTQNTVYEVTDYAVSIEYPHNTSANRMMELYRIDSMRIEHPEALARKGLSNLIINTKNSNIPPVIFQAIPNAVELKEKIEALITESQKKQSIQEIHIPILQA